ncbi:chaplin family protein [Streptomyces sp. NPDC085927]|uniref:chaplin n=1 Tax=Streptomyces sp. NPDC085927 TaxID=3365738 RepID=UPI0037D6B39D
MRQTLSRGAFAAAAATGILSLYGAPALADTYAEGAATNSPGVLSGNNVQAPIEVPVNACGNTIGAVSALNEASGNACVNGSHHDDRSEQRASSTSQSRSGGGGAHAEGVAKNSPGVLSGNNVQAPVHAPVNVCGNTVDVVGVLNEASDNTCVNGSHHDDRSEQRTSSTSQSRSDGGGAHAEGVAEGSPGVLSGNLIQVPVHAPVNVCGNSIGVLGLLNSAYDNDCGNGYTPHEPQKPGDEPEAETPSSPPVRTYTPPATPVTYTPPPATGEEPPHLAETGSDNVLLGSGAGAALLVGGALLYRRGRAAARR